MQVRVLRLRQAVLSRIASGQNPERVRLLLDLVAGERERLIGDFLDAAFAGCGPAYAGIRRSLTPELPGEPTGEQWDAWIELMSLAEDAGFRAGLRAMVATGRLYGNPVTVGVQDFDFMGGSLGMAAGQAVITGLETAARKHTPFVLFVASGGAQSLGLKRRCAISGRAAFVGSWATMSIAARSR